MTTTCRAISGSDLAWVSPVVRDPYRLLRSVAAALIPTPRQRIMTHATIAHPDSVTFLEHYALVVATTDQERDLAYRARYQVYCQELSGYEAKERFPDGREHNAADEHSLQVLILSRETGMAMATARLVLADPRDPAALLPFEVACSDALEPDAVPWDDEARQHIAEMSRFLTVGKIRTRSTTLTPIERIAQELMPHALAHLCLTLAEEIGITSLYAIMEERLAHAMRVADTGIQLMPIGPGVNYHGMRYPFQIAPGGMRERHPDLAEAAARAVDQALPLLAWPRRLPAYR